MTKYVLMFLMLFYTYLCFGKDSARRVLIQKILSMGIFSICFGVIIYNRFSPAAVVVFAIEFIYLIVFDVLFGKIYRNSSKELTSNMTMLLAIGFVILWRLSPDSAIKQLIFAIAGSVGMFFVPMLAKQIKIIVKARWLLAVIGIILLSVTLVLGQTSFGANLSFTIAGFTFQPSEFVKISFVLFIAGMLSKTADRKSVIITGVIAVIHVLILVTSTDLGAALIYFVVYIFAVYIATGKLRYFITGLVCTSGASVLAYKVFSHVRTRIDTWINPWPYIDGKGYQITQSLFAIGTGGLFGLGLCKGSPGSIPVVKKHFIFAAISEELGLIFAIAMVLVCVSIFIRIMRLASVCKDDFYKITASAFAVMYIFQCFLTIGGVTKFIPLTGVTLPLVSYGGSSLISTFFMLGIIQTIFMVEGVTDSEKIES